MFHCHLCCPNTNSLLVPNDIIDMTPWHLTLPIKRENRKDAKIIYNPKLKSFQNDTCFYVSPTHNSILFTANCGGATTRGSHYPRSELREMAGDKRALWTSSGYHELTTVLSINETPKIKRDVVALQIHDGDSDVMQVLVKKDRLYVRGSIDSKAHDYGTLEDNYELGTKFSCKIICCSNLVKVYYNDMSSPKLTFKYHGDDENYFKVGAYVQSNVSKGDAPDTVGSVEVFSCNVVHNWVNPNK